MGSSDPLDIGRLFSMQERQCSDAALTPYPAVTTHVKLTNFMAQLQQSKALTRSVIQGLLIMVPAICQPVAVVDSMVRLAILLGACANILHPTMPAAATKQVLAHFCTCGNEPMQRCLLWVIIGHIPLLQLSTSFICMNSWYREIYEHRGG